MKRGEWHEAARELSAKGMTNGEIAAYFAVTRNAVWKALNPDRAREYWTRDNNRPERNAQKRAIDNHHRSACINCGASMGPSSGWRESKRCKDCWLIHARTLHRERDLQIEAWWREGLKMREIAERLGWSMGHIQQEIHRLRTHGYALPYRRSPQGLENIRNGHPARRKVAA